MNKNESAKSSSSKTPTTSEPGSLHKLRVGDVFKRGDVEYVVWFLNDSRASVAPLAAHLKYVLRESDGKPQFLCVDSAKSENISPGSEVEVVRSLGREGLAKFIDEHKDKNQSEETPMKKKNKNKETTSTPGIRAGSLGTYEGFSIASVVRTLGKAGWNFHEVKAFCDAEKIKASDQTIKLNIYRGVKGVDGEPAPLKSLPKKPKVEAKTAPAKKAAKPAKNGKENATVTKTKNKAAAAAPAKKAAGTEKAAKPSGKAAEQIAALKKEKAAEARA